MNSATTGQVENVKRIVLVTSMLSAALLLIAGCTAGKTEKKIIKKTESPLVHKKTVIEPSRIYEECVELVPGQSMGYSFRTSRPVDFNIHYHGQDSIHYPVSKSGILSWRGTLEVNAMEFYSGEQEYFCLMWENHNDRRVRLEFNCALKQ